jgi:hypothetical protein
MIAALIRIRPQLQKADNNRIIVLQKLTLLRNENSSRGLFL